MIYSNFNLIEVYKHAIEIANIYQNILSETSKKPYIYEKYYTLFNPAKIIETLGKIFIDLYSNPEQFIELQKQYIERSLKLMHYAQEKLQGKSPEPLYQPYQRDKRFKDEAWSNNVYFDFLKQFYLMHVHWLEHLIKQDKRIHDKNKEQVLFFVMQFLDAISPSNFVFTNPTVFYETITTNGKNLVDGFANLLEDVKKSTDIFDISRVHTHEFKLGKTLACTKGDVVFKNDMMELICYTPLQKSNYEIPLLVIPPWINKYYILDLSPSNSLIKYLLDSGITVFLISWVNPTEKHRDKTFENYLSEGALEAINVIQREFGVPKINVIGYCLGGTLAAIMLSYLTYHKKEAVINTSSMLTTLLDYTEAGDLSVFIDDQQLEALEKRMCLRGYSDSDIMSITFSILRANDMIWSFVINNYLLGKKPMSFDVLYWNADSTRLPAKMYSYFLRNMYLENSLIKPNKLSMLGTPIDLGIIKTPCYFISTIDDHIVPWHGTYKGFQHLNCPLKFVLAGSGHVVGIINPPQNNKYSYWKNDKIAKKPDDWFKEAREYKGSWWVDWIDHLQKNSGKKIATTNVEKITKKLSLGDAPGTYLTSK